MLRSWSLKVKSFDETKAAVTKPRSLKPGERREGQICAPTKASHSPHSVRLETSSSSANLCCETSASDLWVERPNAAIAGRLRTGCASR